MDRFKKSLTFLSSLFIVFSLLLFANCSSDSEGENADAQFVGTWNLTSVSVELSIDGKSLVQYLIDNGEMTQGEAELLEDFFKSFLEAELSDGQIELKSDHTYVADFGDDPDTGKWSYDASSKYLTIDSDDPGEDTQMIMVKSITSSTLIIEQKEIVEEDIDDDGTSEEIDAAIEMTFSKD